VRSVLTSRFQTPPNIQIRFFSFQSFRKNAIQETGKWSPVKAEAPSAKSDVFFLMIFEAYAKGVKKPPDFASRGAESRTGTLGPASKGRRG
jgi:hypothetical protein